MQSGAQIPADQAPAPATQLSSDDIEQRTAIVNQFHIIAHALAQLQFDGINEVFRELYSAIVHQQEVNMEHFVTCDDATQRFDATRTYDQYKADALAAIAEFEKLPQTEKYQGKLAECVTRLNNPNTLFSKQTRAHAAMIQMFGLSEDARPVALPGGGHGFRLKF